MKLNRRSSTLSPTIYPDKSAAIEERKKEMNFGVKLASMRYYQMAMKIRTKPILIAFFIIGLSILLFVWVYEGTYHFKFTKPASPEVSAVQSIKGLIVAEFLYHEELKKRKFATLEELAEHQLITTAMSRGTDNHYHFEI